MSDLMNEQKKFIIWELWKKGSPMTNIARSIKKARCHAFFLLRVSRRYWVTSAIQLATKPDISWEGKIPREIIGHQSAK